VVLCLGRLVASDAASRFAIGQLDVVGGLRSTCIE
jgi:hypothetical protein